MDRDEDQTGIGITRPRETRTSSPDSARLYLLVFQGQTSTMFHLPLDGTVVIGRGASADLRLSDDSASRQHARLTLANGEAHVEDLGSRNGTSVNGAPITGSRALAGGDVICICNCNILFYSSLRSHHLKRTLLTCEELSDRAEEEFDRALRFQRALTVAMLLVGDHGDASKVASDLYAQIRKIDIIGQGRPGEIVLLMPETGPSAGLATVRRLAAASGLRGGCGAFPGDGADVDTLFANTRAAAESSPVGEAVAVSTSHRVIHIGDHKVMIADPAMMRIFALIERLATAELPVLICGETGTGKEIAAQAIHHWSARAAHPMVTLNCAAVQENLVESELFGYERGAFSGATAAKPGLLETSEGGTVFLDEIGELSLAAQAKLLRVLEVKRIVRVGGLKEKPVDLRVVAATNKDLKLEVAAGRFRKDLFYRLSAATVWLVPLRDRLTDIPILASSFLADACARLGREPALIADETLQRMLTYRWPGNIRELKNVMDYVASTTSGSVIEPDDVVEHLVDEVPDAIETAHDAVPSPSEQFSPASPESGPRREPADFRSIGDELRELERQRITEALVAADGNRTRAAALIQMPLRTLSTKMRQYGLLDRKKGSE